MLNAKNLGLAAGIIWGVSMFLMTIISLKTGYASGWLTVMAGVYPGYNVSLSGSIIGLIYGFIDGFVGLFIFGWLYNKLENSAK